VSVLGDGSNNLAVEGQWLKLWWYALTHKNRLRKVSITFTIGSIPIHSTTQANIHATVIARKSKWGIEAPHKAEMQNVL